MSQSRLNDLAVLNINADITKVWISVIFKQATIIFVFLLKFKNQ